MNIRETAYAKINLALHVRERMEDGYHRLETVFAFAEDGDRLSVSASDDIRLELGGPFGGSLAGETDNLVIRAARALRNRYGVTAGARLLLDKRLPVAAGLGGGSADAAAALRLLVRFWDLRATHDDLLGIAAGLGADVPACLHSVPCIGRGRGDELLPLADSGLARTPVLLVNPRVELATGDVFRRWDGVDRGPLGSWREGRNDLEPAAIGLVPEIAEVLEALNGNGFARMSGSGATCFALYGADQARDAAAARIAVAHPGWWTLATRLR
jgi:4-diphosphocytidyl-2-C-methyl-D-erythritol kinase